MNNLKHPSLHKLLEYILYSKSHQAVIINVFGPILPLHTPEWQSMQILPVDYTIVLEKCIDFMQNNPHEMHGFKDYEVLKMQRDLDWMKQGTDNVQRKRADFYRFFQNMTARPGTDFAKTFPEMADFWNNCEYYARTE